MSLIRVDFPAPLAPITPTRLKIKLEQNWRDMIKKDDLERERAQLTLYKLGVFLPGYVNVQPESLRMARVGLRTPMSEPGGGNENLTEVAARV